MKSIKEQYQERFKKYGVKSKSLFWKNMGASHQRFRQIWSEINFDNKSVLDVGSGFGQLAKWLNKKYKNVQYCGVDITPEFVQIAQKKYPQYKFYCLDYFEDPLKENFDIVVASGTLNSDYGADNIKFRQKAIKTMFDHTNKVLVFNMLGAHPKPKSNGKNVWYADSLEILEYCMSLTSKVILKQHYNSKDFTIFMYKSE